MYTVLPPQKPTVPTYGQTDGNYPFHGTTRSKWPINLSGMEYKLHWEITNGQSPNTIIRTN